MIQVVPAIIPNTKEYLEADIKKVAGFADFVQIDISDGIFTPFKTWPYNEKDTDFFEQLKKQETGWPRWEDLDYEIHLMVKNPEDVVQDWIDTGAVSIVAHIETTDNFQKVIDICKANDVLVGIAIKPGTDISRIERFVDSVNFIQVMGSGMLGKHGVELENGVVERIKTLHTLYPERIIAIDIGVNLDTKEMLLEAGATKLISGGAILNADNPEEVYNELSAQ